MKSITQECDACSGTGLYIGMGERDRAAVVCSRCAGEGFYEYQYKEFTGRKRKLKVVQVYATNPGICATPEAVPGGVPYKEWLKDPESVKQPGAEMREHTCPAWWYQSAAYELVPRWKECISMGAFTRCRHFSIKSRCWERWDKENARKR